MLFEGSGPSFLRGRVLAILDDPYATGFGGRLLRSPVIRGLSGKDGQPSYLTGETFAQAAVAILRDPDLSDRTRIPTILTALHHEDQDDIEAYKIRLAKWFDGAMERLSGTFLRQAQWQLLIAAFVIAVVFNIDAIALSKALWWNQDKLDPLVEQIITFENNHQDQDFDQLTPNQLTELRNEMKSAVISIEQLANIEFPLGRDLRATLCPAATDGVANECKPSEQIGNLAETLLSIQKWEASKLLGWLITALATIPGGQFWFDVIGRVIRIRSSIKPASKSSLS